MCGGSIFGLVFRVGCVIRLVSDAGPLKGVGSMTISMTDYFRDRKSDRKKETRYINVINKDNCTSCNSCANVCPVDCIYEVVSPVPSESYHQIDTSRCIGCQMCYRSPNDSSEFYQLTICPWNAIDMLHNPNSKPDDVSVLLPYSLPPVRFMRLMRFTSQHRLAASKSQALLKCHSVSPSARLPLPVQSSRS